MKVAWKGGWGLKKVQSYIILEACLEKGANRYLPCMSNRSRTGFKEVFDCEILAAGEVRKL